MRLAGIDIGTNTVLMLIADVDRTGVLTPVRQFHEIPRLGRHVDKSRSIGAAGVAEVSRILKVYAAELKAAGCSAARAVATSAMRDARNGPEVARKLSDASGIEVSIISGETEARLTWAGVAAGSSIAKPFALLDIGGGSTELIVPAAAGRSGATGGPDAVGSDGDELMVLSVDAGSVRITERFFGPAGGAAHAAADAGVAAPAHTASAESLRAAGEFIDQMFTAFPSTLGGVKLIGVAGTATTLACIDAGAERVAQIEGRILSAEAVRELGGKLLRMTPEDIRRLTPVAAGREDILGAGALLLAKAMERLGTAGIGVSTAGLRHGVVMSLWRELTGGRPEAPASG